MELTADHRVHLFLFKRFIISQTFYKPFLPLIYRQVTQLFIYICCHLFLFHPSFIFFFRHYFRFHRHFSVFFRCSLFSKLSKE